jgi:DNA-binding PadR family transcriptional regulator
MATTRPKRSPNDLLPLKPLHFLMLLTLADGDRHAYRIKKDLAAQGSYRDLGPGTLYRSIEQLITAGLIEESDRRPVPELDDERRRYYHLTAFGRLVAMAEAERLASLVRAATVRRLLNAVSRS